MDSSSLLERTGEGSVKLINSNLQDVTSSMGFLFAKVNRSILDSVGEYPCFLVDYCLHRCLAESKKIGGVTKDAILYSTVIKRILKIIQDFSYSLKAESQQLIIDYIFRSWDFSAEVVCHEAVDIFSMLLSNHSLQCTKCKTRKGCAWSDSLVSRILEGESECRSKYKCFHILLRSHSTYTKFMDGSLLEKLYSLIGNPTLSVVISDILSFDLVETPNRWHIHVTRLLSCLSSTSNDVKNAVKDRLLPKLIKTKLLKDEFLPLLIEEMKVLTSEDSLQFQCLDSLLAVSRFLILSHKKCDSYKYWSDYVPLETMQYAVLHCNVQVRLAAWNLLCEHPQRTHAFTVDDLRLIRVFITTNLAEQSPAIREKIVAGLKKVLCRMAETSEQFLKGKGGDAAQVEHYNDLIKAILSLSFESLSLGANFCRRITALSILQCFYVKDTMRPHGKTLFYDQLNLCSAVTLHQFATLVSCLDDSFQLCQIMALDILKSLPVAKGFDFDAFKNETIDMMRSIRSHNTLVTGYRMQFYVHFHPTSARELLYYLVNVCETNTKAAKDSLLNITHCSIHPWMNTIALLLEDMDFSQMSSDDARWWKRFLQQRLIPLCFDIAAVAGKARKAFGVDQFVLNCATHTTPTQELVTPVVHSMSPEGYVPEDTLMKMADSSASGNQLQMAAEVSQVLLVCCWRAHKHVSAILAWAVVKFCPQSFLTSEEVHRIGAFYWLQLTECKHCGAFETAVEGFFSLCTYLWRSDDPTLPKPVEWLREILDALDGKKDLQNLCSTRRSAGVPHLVTTILATESLNHPSQSLKVAMTSLLDMSRKSVAYRVHSLNVLKAIFSSAALGERVTAAIELACRVAVSGCSATTWPERNAAAQLAAALRARIFGVAHKGQRGLHVDSKNRQSAYEFFSRFPSLYSYLFEQLCAPKDEFSVYPILIFLTHLFPSNVGVTAMVETNGSEVPLNFPLAPFILAMIRVLLWCRAEKLRRLTVAALTAIATLKDILFLLDWINKADLANVRQNHVNAVLLLLTSILEINRGDHVLEGVSAILSKLIDSAIWMKCHIGYFLLSTGGFSSLLRCDMNKNLFLLLCNDLGLTYDIALDYEDLVLSKRPLAYAILKSGRFLERLSSDMGWRMEMYRCLQMTGSPNEFFKHMRDFAIEDLKCGANERNLACILEMMYVNRQYLVPKKRKLADIIRHGVAEVWRMPETIAMAYRLLVFVCHEDAPSADDRDWLESCVNAEEEMPKRIALEVGAHHLKRGNDCRLVSILASFLEDDDLSIREEASAILSRHTLKSDIVLNPGVCFRLIFEKIPQFQRKFKERKQNYSHYSAAVDESAEVLFDASSVNPYAETRVFGDFSEVKSMVAGLKEVQ